MTKLEEEIWDAIGRNYYAEPEQLANAAAEVAKKYIEKAFTDGWERRHNLSDYDSLVWPEVEAEARKAWLKENGITE